MHPVRVVGLLPSRARLTALTFPLAESGSLASAVMPPGSETIQTAQADDTKGRPCGLPG
jgi:hypothetical protein